MSDTLMDAWEEISDLKRKLKELEDDLTTAYMAGYHKRDDEVRNLRAHADALAGALEGLLADYRRWLADGAIVAVKGTRSRKAFDRAAVTTARYRQSQEGQGEN